MAVQLKAIRRTTAALPSVQSLEIPLVHLAREIFYHDHVFGESKGYSFMGRYYAPAAGDEHLMKSIAAVSLAYLTHQKHHSKVQTEARLQYVDALKLTNKALLSPKLATEDSTMLSILLLDLYEKISSTEPRYDGAWAAHLQGALSLIQLRSDEQYRDCDSLRMLERLSTNVLISCVVSDMDVPDDLAALNGIVTSPANRKEMELMVRFASLKNQVKRNLLSDHDVVRASVELDEQFLDLSQQLPSSWLYEIVHVNVNTAHHYEDYHHMYSSEYIGQMWNVLRITRILICELIFVHFPKPDRSDLGQTYPKDYAITTIDHLSREICATVPQSISSHAQQPDTRPYGPCYRLIFPLYVAAQSLTASTSIKRYAIKELQFMAEQYAIKQALDVSKILESEEKMDPWKVYALLGSYAFVC